MNFEAKQNNEFFNVVHRAIQALIKELKQKNCVTMLTVTGCSHKNTIGIHVDTNGVYDSIISNLKTIENFPIIVNRTDQNGDAIDDLIFFGPVFGN